MSNLIQYIVQDDPEQEINNEIWKKSTYKSPLENVETFYKKKFPKFARKYYIFL